MHFGDTAELPFPIAIEDDPVDVTAAGIGLPAIGFRGAEADVHGGAGGIVGIEDGHDGLAVHFGSGDGGGDAFAGHIGEGLVEKLGGVRAASADETGIEPLFGDALQVAEEIEAGFLAGLAPMLFEQALGEVEEHGGGAGVGGVFETEIDAFADDAFIAGFRGADEVRGEVEDGIGVEGGGEAFLGELDAVAGDAGEADFEVVAVGADGFDLDGFAGLLRRGDNGLGGEVEGDAENVGVFRGEEAVAIKVVGLAAEGAADDLFAEKLSAEGAHAEDVGDGVGVPAFGEHRDRDDTANGFAEAAFLADGVHGFAEEGVVGEVVGTVGVAGALHNVAAEAFDFVDSGGAEVVVEGVPGGELFTIDEEGVRTRKRAAVLIEVAEEGESAMDKRTIPVIAMEAGDVVVDELGGGGVVAHHDEAGRDADGRIAPEVEGFFVVAVEGFEGGLEFDRNAKGVESFGFAPAFFWHFGADVVPEIAELGHVAARDVVGDGNAGEFDDAALDGVHEGEVAHGPGKESAFGVARATEEERGGGEIEDARDAELAFYGFEAGDPEAGGFVVALGFFAVVTF